MTDQRDQDRHLKPVGEHTDDAEGGDDRSSSADPDAVSGSSGDDGEASDVLPHSGAEARADGPGGSDDEPEGLRAVSDEQGSEDSEGLRVVEDGPDDPVTAERDQLRETLQRVQADFENFRKRVMRDQGSQLERATEKLIEQMLPVLDSFELAVLSIPEGELDDASAKLRKGVELVYAELLGVLEKAGLERVEALGATFDPEEHEAVMREGEGQQVTEVMRTGYRLKGRVLRPAMVKVGGEGDAPSDE